MQLEHLLKKVRAIEIRTRGIVNSTFNGHYHSAFKGQGMSFSEVRAYQPGDDVRAIDWKVTARARSPHIKVFEEERDLTVQLMVDISASGNFGSDTLSKVELAAEIAAILGFSAIGNQDKVGLCLFSEDIESYVPPKTGKSHVLRLIRDIFYYKPERKGTRLDKAFDYMLRMMKKRGIVFVISDFLDENFETSFKLLSRRHDVVPIVVRDPRELALSASGIVALEDEETGEVLYLNTSDPAIQGAYKNLAYAHEMSLNRLFKSCKVDPIYVSTTEDYVPALIRYFKRRESL